MLAKILEKHLTTKKNYQEFAALLIMQKQIVKGWAEE